MDRKAFVGSLLGSVAATQAGHISAALAIDEAGIGREVFNDLRNKGDILFDSPFYEHVNEIGQVLARTVKERYQYPLRYLIVRGDSPNAFSVPGGTIYINEPLLRMARNRDELAGVMAHEAGHMAKHHVARLYSRAQTAGLLGSLGSILGQILLGPIASIGTDAALSTTQNAVFNNLSRHDEADADEEGARIVAATNLYNPYGMIWFFDTLRKTYGEKGAFWERDHPFDSARIADLEHLFRSEPQTFGKFANTMQSDVAYW